MKINYAWKLAAAIGVSLLAGFIGSVFTMPAISEWYATLVKPELAPPNWVFGPVWTTLYVLMGIALSLVWKRGLDQKWVKVGLGIFAGQLILNTLWSIVFFGLQSPGGGVVVIAILWLVILVTIFVFAKVSKVAAWLLVPYILWVSFASYLNFSIFVLNS